MFIEKKKKKVWAKPPPTGILIVKYQKFYTEWECKPKYGVEANEHPSLMKPIVSDVYV